MKTDQFKDLTSTYDKELKQTIDQVRILQEQLDVAKHKYDEVHTELDETDN